MRENIRGFNAKAIWIFIDIICGPHKITKLKLASYGFIEVQVWPAIAVESHTK